MNDKEMKPALSRLIDHTLPAVEAVNLADTLAMEFPFFSLPSELLLRFYSDALSPEQRARAEKRVALTSPDPTALFRLTTADGTAFENFYPPEQKPSVTTNEAIATFLDAYGEEDPGESALLEKLIFNPVADYSATLAAGETHSPTPGTMDETFRRIDSFMKSHPVAPPADEPAPAIGPAPQTAASDSLLSESLAKIYIKQHRYDKAYEIIRQLSLNYPEKSCYFADQLRFLKKLIINQNFKNNSK